jgi:hypothetical protein
MFSMGETFFMSTRIIENNMYFCLLHEGLRNKAPSYKYRASINKQDGSSNISVYAATKSLLNDVEKIFRKQDCGVLGQEY